MVRANKILVISLLSIWGGTFISAAWAEDYRFNGILSCSKMGNGYPEYTDAGGEVFFQFDESKQELTYKLQVEKIEDAYMAHLHAEPFDKQAQMEKDQLYQLPIAAWLYPYKDHDAPDRCIVGEFTGTLAEGVIKLEDLEKGITFDVLIEAMLNGNAYTNVHTRKYITSEISGQIKPTSAGVSFIKN